jgi:radical SAM protein with 4Fe4S-binding SPASM domain
LNIPAEFMFNYMAYSEYLLLGRERFLAQGANCPEPNDPAEQCGQAGEGVRCRAGRCSFWITWQGNMLPCGMFPTETNLNVFRDAFPVAWEQVKKDTAAIRLPGQCAACSAKDSCHTCAAMVITESGSFQKLPQYRCDMIRAYKAQWDRVKEEIL